MAKQRLAKPAFMAERMARELAKADGEAFEANPSRYRRLTIPALKAFGVLTEAMIDAAHEVASFEDHWAIALTRRSYERI